MVIGQFGGFASPFQPFSVNTTTPKGEIVLLVGAADPGQALAETEATLDEKLRAALARHTVKDAAALVAGETGLARRTVYARALALAREEPGR